MAEVERLLERGAVGEGKHAGMCRSILRDRDSPWTFVSEARVEPTNNLAERMVRQAVLWRRSSFGTQSERGARYVERILTVCATCRLQGRSLVAYLREACRCHANGQHAPLLIQQTAN